MNKFLIFLLIIFIYNNNIVYAVENEKAFPKICMSAGASFGYYNINHKYGEYLQWIPGYGLGGGIVFESMLTDIFGIHSGLWFSQFSLKLKFPQNNGEDDTAEDTMVEHEIKTNILTMPFYLITSLSTKFIMLNLLSGFNLSYIVESHMEPGPDSQTTNEDIKKYLGYGQLGVGGGIEILVRITRFTRFFISGIAEYYFTDLIPEEAESSDFLYNFNLRSGFMLCTF